MRGMGSSMLFKIVDVYTFLIIPELWRQWVKYKEAFCLVLNRNKDPFTNNWRHTLRIINKVYNEHQFAVTSMWVL